MDRRTTRQRRRPWQLRDARPSTTTSLDCHGPRRCRVEDLAMTNQCVMREVHGKIPVPIGICTRPQELPKRHCEAHDATASCAVASQGRSSIRDHVPRLPRSSPLSRRRPRNDESMRYASGSSKDPSSHRNLHTAPRTSKPSLRGARRDSVVRRGN